MRLLLSWEEDEFPSFVLISLLERQLWAHWADRVPKVSAKKCQVTPTWHNCHFTPPAPSKWKVCIFRQILTSRLQIFKVPLYPLPSPNTKLAFVDRSWDQDFRYSKCHFTHTPKCKVGVFGQIMTSDFQSTTLPLPPIMQSLYFWTDLVMRTSDFQSNSPPPHNTKLAFLTDLDFRTSDFQSTPLPPYLHQSKVGTFWQILQWGLQILKVPLYLPQIQSWHFWTDLDFRTSDFQSVTLTPFPQRSKVGVFGQILTSGHQIQIIHFLPL